MTEVVSEGWLENNYYCRFMTPSPCPNDPAGDADDAAGDATATDDADDEDSSSKSRHDTTARFNDNSVLALRRVGIHRPKCLANAPAEGNDSTS